MKKLLNQKQVDELKRAIDKELEIRCINVQTTLVLDEKNDFNLTSTFFQTVPVLHTGLRIEDFGGKVMDCGEDKVKFFIRVSCRYDGNGTNLFSISGVANKKIKDNIFIEQIRSDIR